MKKQSLYFRSYFYIIARGSNMSMGWSTGSSKAEASQKAVSQCVAYSGIACVALLAECS